MGIYLCNSNSSTPTSPYDISQGVDQAAHSIKDCITAGASKNDIILFHTGSTPHYEALTAAYTLTGPTNEEPLTIEGVDFDDAFSYLPASTWVLEVTSGTGHITFNGGFVLNGLHCLSLDEIDLSADLNEFFYGKDCYFKSGGGSGDDINYTNGIFQNTTFDVGSNGLIKHSGTLIELCGGAIISSFSADAAIDSSSAHSIVRCIGVDFSNCAAPVIDPYTSGGNLYEFIGCIKHPTYDWVKTNDPHFDLRVMGTDTVAGNDQWTMEKRHSNSNGAVMTLSRSVYRDGGGSYDGSSNFSWCFEPGSITDFNYFLRGAWNSLYVPAGDGQNIEVYIASTAAGLTNKEFAIEVAYYGSTANTLYTVVDTRPIHSATGTALTSDTSTWTGIAETAYKISLASNIDIKKDGHLLWRPIFSDPTNTIYMDSQVSVV